jgi:hypothetical protein
MPPRPYGLSIRTYNASPCGSIERMNEVMPTVTCPEPHESPVLCLGVCRSGCNRDGQENHRLQCSTTIGFHGGE